ncbi:D-lactonohydrolase-like protein-like protein [Mollisia scopiformis]|uniref:D-lactonohydrolase-like protein-like protein n=1 Tax=Mollisia scopiformis TaxID=149040 RepID=A0A194X8T1_MOLSC|nr:D-lactonohydrolase-like protein-like protein [Mollisia scopiformis]KUJ16583.1 D-lactonohydrolase-like protein-like protein [Mollisia scopiformis]
MASVTNADITVVPTKVEIIDRLAEANGKLKAFAAPKDQVSILQYQSTFGDLLGPSPTHSLLLSTEGTSHNPFFHEACVFLPKYDEVYITSNLLQSTSSSTFPTILISRVKLHRGEKDNVHKVEWAKMRPPPGIDMPNGGVNYEDGILFCAQGTSASGTGGIYYMPRTAPPKAMVTNFHGRDFNSVNDVVVSKDGCIWFTDPWYGHEQDFRSRPKLPNQVYRFDPKTGDIRVVADGFGRCNGLCFDFGETVCYITDTDQIHGDGTKDLMRPATIYAYDIITRAGAPFLANRRVFAYAAVGFPDGIKCDLQGNVYSGCGDGVEVWNPAGTLIGRIMVPGGVANFCFGKDGEMFLCAEQKLWRLQMTRTTKGALLGI